MNYKLGDKLISNYDAFNVVTKEVLYPKGTEVEIVHIKNGMVNLKFPDGQVHPHQQIDIPPNFTNSSTGAVILQNTILGYGTPPKSIHKYLPKESNWKKNYVWKIYIELEEREDKELVCPDCTNEIKPEKISEIGQVECENCGTNVVPYNLKQKEEGS